jgi:hypothetical protein
VVWILHIGFLLAIDLGAGNHITPLAVQLATETSGAIISINLDSMPVTMKCHRRPVHTVTVFPSQLSRLWPALGQGLVRNHSLKQSFFH